MSSPRSLWRPALVIVVAAAQTTRGALSASVHIDEESVAAFLSDEDICGDFNHRESCLQRGGRASER